MIRACWLAAGLAAIWAGSLAADDALRVTLGDKPLAAHWIYDDLPRGESLAKTTGKPLLVLFRCVPCQCASALDAELTDPASPVNELLKKYVCVRIVHFRGIDLNRFQFDYDVSLVAVLMNATDGTLYGRYGTRAVRNRAENTHISLASFEKFLARGLAAHARYPFNKDELAGKQPRPVPFKTAEEMPDLADLAKRPVTRENCIHCHMAGEGLLKRAAQEGKLRHGDIWRFPLPENAGALIDKEDGLVVKAVRPGSAADKAGLRPGDELRMLGGQALLSIADIQWVLHHLPERAEVNCTLRRGTETVDTTLSLAGDWKRTDVSWRETLSGIRSGLVLGQITSGERQQFGLAGDAPALSVRYAFREAARAGFRSGEVVVAVDDKPPPQTEGDFLAYCRLGDSARKSVKLTVLSKRAERRDLVLPLDE